MAGRIRRLLRTVPVGRVDLGEMPALARRKVPTAAHDWLLPSAALARGWLARELAGVAADRCLVLGPGRLVSAATLPFACATAPLPLDDGPPPALAGVERLVIGDALAATDDPPAVLGRIVEAAGGAAGPRLLVVLPGTALLPDDEPPCPRRWLFSGVSAAAMAREVLDERAGPVTVLGNVLAASTDLLGLPAEKLWPDELAAVDLEYPLVVAFSCRGRAAVSG